MTGVIKNNIPYVKCRFGKEDPKTKKEVKFVVDTGCTGEVVSSPNLAEYFKLEKIGRGEMEVGDKRKVPCDYYQGWIEWFGQNRKIQVKTIVNCSDSFLGMELLNYRTLKLKGSELEISID